MSVKLETAEEIEARAERGMAIAQQIIKDSWLSEGMTEEEWERDQIVGEVFARLLSQGLSPNEADDYLQKMSWEQIQGKHREMYPRQYAKSNGQ